MKLDLGSTAVLLARKPALALMLALVASSVMSLGATAEPVTLPDSGEWDSVYEEPATRPSAQGDDACAHIRCLRVVGDASDRPVAMQERPRAWADIVGTIPAGANDVIPVGERATSASIEWIQVEYKGARGWVPAQFLTE